MNPKIVITGASGFIGQALIKQLSKNGIDFLGFSRKETGGITTTEDSVLVHLAQSNDTSSKYSEEDIQLCHTLSRKPWSHIIYISSAAIYDDKKLIPHQPEELVYAKNDYTRQKLVCEKIFLNAGGTCLRFANLYGPGMGIKVVISDIMRQIPGKGPLILRDISTIRDFLWIDDATQSIISTSQRSPGGIFNVGSGNGIEVGKVAQLALDLYGENNRPVVAENSSTYTSCITLDITKTMVNLNWSPRVDITEGLLSLLNGKING
jgi:nucleoside-diphosphate-sugar epimerase